MIKKLIILFCFININCQTNSDNTFSYHKSVFGSDPEFNSDGIAKIISPDGWVAVTKKGKVLFQIFNYDNGPDYTSEGLYRIVKNNKMGFANEKGEIIIQPVYDWVEPFEDGLANYCNGCYKEYMGEHYRMVGGNWGKISIPKINK